MDAIYSQSAFMNTPIDIRFGPAVIIDNPSLVSIDTEAELDALLALQPSPAPGINVFFVDAINVCGGQPAPGTIGCGEQPGNSLAVHSLTAAGSFGAALISHELGHNLGLAHVDQANPNLMNPTLTGDTTLTVDQATTVFVSPLVQIDNAFAYVVLTPIAVIPEPASVAFAMTGLALAYLFAGARRRQRLLRTRSA